MENTINIVQIPRGRKAIIKFIHGGAGLIQKLDSLGLRMGKEIIKISAGIGRGPVVVKCGNTEVAIGFGMAQKIFVQII